MTSPASASAFPEKLRALPESWIDKIFGGMEAMYGSLFHDRWKGTDLAKVKAVWAEELASFTDHPQCFGLALKALVNESKFPPSLPEFVAICRKNYVRPDAGLLLENIPLGKDEAAKLLKEIRVKCGI